MPYNVKNIMRVGWLGSKVINRVLLDEALSYVGHQFVLKFI